MPEARRFQESRMPGNPLVRFDEGRVGRTTCRPLSYSTGRGFSAPRTYASAKFTFSMASSISAVFL